MIRLKYEYELLFKVHQKVGLLRASNIAIYVSYSFMCLSFFFGRIIFFISVLFIDTIENTYFLSSSSE